MLFDDLYFKQNPKWYYFDDEKHFVYKLTADAPYEAIESYFNYLKQLLKFDKFSIVLYEEIKNEFLENKAKQIFGLGGKKDEKK